jgi:hypothetical protein
MNNSPKTALYLIKLINRKWWLALLLLNLFIQLWLILKIHKITHVFVRI